MSKTVIYRILKRKWLDTAFDGEGARRFGGRWNNKSKPCIYMAGSESLAILEVLVHIESDAILNAYCLIRSVLPNSEIMTLGTLPKNWRTEPAPPDTANFGDQWLKSKQSLALQVPSVIVPRESNYILNPLHQGMQTVINNAEEIDLSIDPRLL